MNHVFIPSGNFHCLAQHTSMFSHQKHPVYEKLSAEKKKCTYIERLMELKIVRTVFFCDLVYSESFSHN